MIALVRVDNRLLHGQVLEAWLPRLRARRILVADDDAAASPLARAAMSLCVPPGVQVEVGAIAGVDWPSVAASGERVLVLFREVDGLARAAAHGLSAAFVPEVNLGNVHFATGRLPVTPSVFLSPDEGRTLERLAGDGFTIRAQAVPGDAPVALAEAVRRSTALTA